MHSQGHTPCPYTSLSQNTRARCRRKTDHPGGGVSQSTGVGSAGSRRVFSRAPLVWQPLCRRPVGVGGRQRCLGAHRSAQQRLKQAYAYVNDGIGPVLSPGLDLDSRPFADNSRPFNFLGCRLSADSYLRGPPSRPETMRERERERERL
jgi:hypothetical protein